MTKSHCVFVPWRPAFPQFVNGTTCAINTDAYRQPCGYRFKSLQVPSWSHEVKLWDCSYATVALQQIACVSLSAFEKQSVCVCVACGVWESCCEGYHPASRKLSDGISKKETNKDQWPCFSPPIFLQTFLQTIASYPWMRLVCERRERDTPRHIQPQNTPSANQMMPGLPWLCQRNHSNVARWNFSLPPPSSSSSRPSLPFGLCSNS